MIHWQVRFKSLRNNRLYTASIYDDQFSGNPIHLKGAARPFETEEDAKDDLFNDIITQSGYLRIVNDKKDYNGNTLPDNWWRDVIPATDISRPVILTDDYGNILWQGFLQAQNFGMNMYVNAQEISLPVQCALATLSRIDMNADAYTGQKNFAALLDYALDILPLDFENIYIQGGADAMQWMIKRFDWRIFGETDQDGVYDSNCSVFDALEDMCKYWGWTMRTHQDDIYLTCVDDTSVPNFLSVTRAQLTTMAGGTPTGTIDSDGYTTVAVYDEFASADNIDMQMRGKNKASLTANVGEIEDKMAFLYPDSVLHDMDEDGYSPDPVSGIEYTPNKGSFTSKWLAGQMMASSVVNSYFCIRRESNGTKFTPVIKDAAPYRELEGSFCRFDQLVPNMIDDGKFTINFERVDNGESSDGFWFCLAVSTQYSGGTTWYWNGTDWSSTLSYFQAASGYEIPTGSCPISFGYVTLMLHGWVEDIIADMSGLELIFSRKQLQGRLFNTGNREENVYTAKNNAVVRDEWSESTMFCSDNYCKFGPGVIINPNNTYFKGWDYAQHSNASSIPAKQPGYNPIVLASPSQPEQHLVNRIVKYWSQSRRKIECNLRSDLVATLSPSCKVNIDGTTMYPICISRNWRDDAMKVIMYQVGEYTPPTPPDPPTPVLPYDAEVEYLESTGTQWVDSGIECTSDLKVEFTGMVTTNVNAAACGGIANLNPYFRHHWTPYTGSFYWIQYNDNSSSSIQNTISTNTWYDIVVDPVNGTASINGTAKTFTAITAVVTTGQNYFIFARKSGDGGTQSRPCRFKSFKMWRNGTLIRDFIPVRVNTTGYMYDMVSGELFGNAGTGAFTLGPDKNT